MAQSPRPCTLAVLAGGRSRRFGGRNKAFLPWKGRPLVRHVWESLKPHVARSLFVVADLLPWVPFVDALRSEGRRPPVFVDDGHPGAGLPGALRSALEASCHDWVFAVACDLPHPSPEVFHALWELREGVGAVCPRRGPHREPLFALYHREICLSPLAAMIEGGERRLAALFDAVPHAHLEGEALEALLAGLPHDPFTNVNDPGDWDRLLEE